MANLLILKNSEGKIPYINRGGVKTFINYSNEAVRLANNYLNKVYSYPQGVIQAGIQNYANIAFNIDGAINNATNWYDYDIAKNIIIDIFEDIIQNKGGFSTLLIYLDYRAGIQLNNVSSVWKIQKAFNLNSSQEDLYQNTSSRQPSLLNEAFNFNNTSTAEAFRFNLPNPSLFGNSIIVKTNIQFFTKNHAGYLINHNRAGGSVTEYYVRRLTTERFRTVMLNSIGGNVARDTSNNTFSLNTYMDLEHRVLLDTTTLQILINNTQVYISTNFNPITIATEGTISLFGISSAAENIRGYIKTFQLNSY